MALYYDLPLYKDCYDFILKVFTITKKFEREYKYSLWQDMKKEAISLIRNIYRANKTYNKTQYLQQILDDLEVLKLEFRLCRDMKLISIWDYVWVFQTMETIWKQVNAWNNASKK